MVQHGVHSKILIKKKKKTSVRTWVGSDTCTELLNVISADTKGKLKMLELVNFEINKLYDGI